MRQQAEAGIDVVSDGEFGKSISWSQYVLERLSGFERRPVKPGANPFQRGADRARFAEFYAELDAREGVATTHAIRCASGRSRYTGQAELQRDIDNFKAALEGAKVDGGVPAGGGAGERDPRPQERILQERRGAARTPSAEAMRTEYRMIVDAGFLLQLDDARAAVTYDRMVPPASFADYRNWLGDARRGDQPRDRRHPAGAHPLSRLLGQLARPAHHRRAAQGHRRPDPAR